MNAGGVCMRAGIATPKGEKGLEMNGELGNEDEDEDDEEEEEEAGMKGETDLTGVCAFDNCIAGAGEGVRTDGIVGVCAKDECDCIGVE